jgi:hypothetical protein
MKKFFRNMKKFFIGVYNEMTMPFPFTSKPNIEFGGLFVSLILTAIIIGTILLITR